MKNIKTIIVTVIFILALVALIGGGVYYIVKNIIFKDEVSLAEKTADYSMSCDSIYQEFKSNKETASQKFLGKTIILSGVVNNIEKIENNVNVVYKVNSGEAVVSCTLDSLNAPKLKTAQGEKLVLKGEYVGYEDDLMFVEIPEIKFNRCVIVNK
jgi:uncharacterized protein (DUF1330 family)